MGKGGGGKVDMEIGKEKVEKDEKGGGGQEKVFKNEDNGESGRRRC